MTVQVRPAFYFFVHTDAQTESKMDLKPIERLLNEEIQFSDYGSGVNQAAFVFIADSPEYDDDQFANKIEYRAYENMDIQSLNFILPLFYKRILQSTVGEVQAMAVRITLAALESENLQGIPDFDLPAFKKAVRKVLGEMER